MPRTRVRVVLRAMDGELTVRGAGKVTAWCETDRITGMCDVTMRVHDFWFDEHGGVRSARLIVMTREGGEGPTARLAIEPTVHAGGCTGPPCGLTAGQETAVLPLPHQHPAGQVIIHQQPSHCSLCPFPDHQRLSSTTATYFFATCTTYSTHPSRTFS